VVKSIGWFHYFISKGFFSALNKRGVSVVVYGGASDPVYNSLATYRLCKEAGANAICTDKPSMLQRLIAKEGPLVKVN